MSLRVDDDRAKARSHSRTRDRSRSDVGRSTVSDSKYSKSSRRERDRGDGSDDDRRDSRMPGAFDVVDEDVSNVSAPSRATKRPESTRDYQIREPKASAAMPSMPSMGFASDESDHDLAEGLAYGDDASTRPGSKPIRRHIGPGGIPYPAEPNFMPHFPAQSDEDEMYANPPQFKYAPQPDKIKYKSASTAYGVTPIQYKPEPSIAPLTRTRSGSTTASIKYKDENSSRSKRDDSQAVPSKRLSLSTNEPRYDVRAPSPAGRDRRGDRLSVSGNRPDVSGLGAGAKPPASPLLEAYHGTYQQASPMPSPMMLPQDLDDIPSLSDLDLKEDKKKSSKKTKKSVKLYDAEGDAETLAKALNHHEARAGPLIDILPELTHDQLLALRSEYKKRVKTSGRGVNITKQIKMTTTGNFGKAVYATSLGKWESESYWANFWYQSGSSNRELLIEALMGRSNADVREIKAGFRDKRYDDDLSRCMERELKPDKFRMAVLLALEGKRQEETDTYPTEYRNKDVDIMYNALKSREGGETAIVQLVVLRSDSHLRECLKTFERVHQLNFAREALRKSNNLVGEVIAHILNGVINRVARDTLLLHHAIEDIAAKDRKVAFRYELLMSRLIRLHWDRLHLARVREEYRRKYDIELEDDIDDATKGDFREFMLRLCDA